MSAITDRIASLAVDAGMTVAELADATGASKLPERVAAGGEVSSLEIALVAQFTGRDPMWIITGEWPDAALVRALDRYAELSFDQ